MHKVACDARGWHLQLLSMLRQQRHLRASRDCTQAGMQAGNRAPLSGHSMLLLQGARAVCVACMHLWLQQLAICMEQPRPDASMAALRHGGLTTTALLHAGAWPISKQAGEGKLPGLDARSTCGCCLATAPVWQDRRFGALPCSRAGRSSTPSHVVDRCSGSTLPRPGHAIASHEGVHALPHTRPHLGYEIVACKRVLPVHHTCTPPASGHRPPPSTTIMWPVGQ